MTHMHILDQPHGNISLPQESLRLSQGTSLSSHPVLQEEEVPLSKRACFPSDISCTSQHQSHTTFPQHKESSNLCRQESSYQSLALSHLDQVHFMV